jgi:hypothetical protein
MRRAAVQEKHIPRRHAIDRCGGIVRPYLKFLIELAAFGQGISHRRHQSVFQRSRYRFAVRENASEHKAGASVPIQSERNWL